MSNTSADADVDADTPSPVFLPLESYRIQSLPPSAYYIPSFLTPEESTLLLTNISNQPWTTLTHRRLQPHPAPLTPTGHLLTTKSLPEYLTTPIVDRLLTLSFSNKKDPSEDEETDGSLPEKPTGGIFTTSPHSRPNHVLINEYPPGTGISPHEDGGAYFPVVCTVSLGSHIVLEVTPKHAHRGHDEEKEGNDDNKGKGGNVEEKGGENLVYRIFQEPLSLLVTMDEVYKEHLHGIEAVEVDEGLDERTVANWSVLGEETRRRIEEGGGRVRREGVRISLTYRDVLKVKDVGRMFGGRGLGRKK